VYLSHILLAVICHYFVSVSQLPYGPIVYPVITAVILMWLFAFTKYILYAVPYLFLILTAYRVKVALEQQKNKEKNF
jgi:DMSO/TMAO reductase YedYZ heme-binding membrane subunit